MTAPAQDQELAESVRRAARRFVTGVTIVAVRHADDIHAMTANSFVTLSLRPALVGICVAPEGRMRPHMRPGRRFGISVLNGAQSDYARHFADRRRPGTMPPLDQLTPGGPPLVPDCAAYFVCDVEYTHAVGDHDLLVGSVVDCGVRAAGTPLTFLDGEFGGSG
jgi:flavin reductase (DIM6/NTAB) family NADH-FMN oxidoreductase RutF